MAEYIKHTCKGCIHFKICNDYVYLVGRDTKVVCPDFKSTADVVPRSEVEQLRKSVDDALKMLGIENKKVKKLQKQLSPFREKQCFTCKYLGIGHDHMPCYRCKDYNEYVWLSADVETIENSYQDDLEKAKQEVAREIFEELENMTEVHQFNDVEFGKWTEQYVELSIEDIAELKKKYIGE